MTTRNKVFSNLSVLILVILTSCGGGQAVELEPALTLSPTVAFTPSSTFTPEPTFTPTATSTPRIPVLPGTQMPVSDVSISADNLDQVVELARWGKGVITDAVFSPDGKLIAVATTLGVSLYETDTLNEILYFDTDASVNNVIFSPDGETIATGLSDNTLKVWNTMDASLIMSLAGHIDENPRKDTKSEVTSIAFSPDGSQLAVGGIDGVISLWQVSDGKLVNTFENHTERISSVFFSPDGQELFSSSLGGKVQSSGGGKVQMVNVVDGKLIRTFLGVSIIDASLSNDGKILATYDTYYYLQGGIIHTEDKLILWDVESGEKLDDVLSQGFIGDNTTTNLAFSPNSQFIAAVFQDRTVKIWDVANVELKNTFNDLIPNGRYYLSDFTISFSPDSQFLLMAGSNVIGVWDIQNDTLISNSIIKSEEIFDIALSPDMKTVAAIEGPNLDLIQVIDGTLLPTWENIQSRGGLAFSPDGTTLAASMFDSAVQLWPVSDQGVKKSFEAEDGYSAIGGVAFSPDGQTLAYGTTYTGKVEMRRISDSSLLATMPVEPDSFVGLVYFSPDGNYLAAATWERIRLFQLPDGKLLQTYNRGPGIAFSPDSALLAGGYKDKTITVWNVPKGDVLFTIKDSYDEVQTLAFSPDGQFLVAGYLDGTIEVFLASDGSLLKSWKGHTRAISDLLFSPDGRQLITSSWDGTIRVWGIKP